MASPCQLPFTGEPLKEESTVFHRVRQGNLQYSVADSLAGASHGFTTRLGGVSTGHLASLNLGHHRGDDPVSVYENYRLLGQALGFTPEDTVFPVQRHTDIIRVVTRENRGEGLFRGDAHGLRRADHRRARGGAGGLRRRLYAPSCSSTRCAVPWAPSMPAGGGVPPRASPKRPWRP